jgi:DNA modification methylase
LVELQGELKDLTEREAAKLRKSMREKTIFVPWFIWPAPDGNNYILDGHQRKRVLVKDGQGGLSVPCVIVEAESLQDAKERLLVISSQYGHITQEGLDTFAFDLDDEWLEATTNFDALNFVFGDDEAEEPETVDAEPQTDRAAELQEKWQTATGQLWAIGEHRLLCGDSTKREDVERVMGGEKAEAVVTDPPYGQIAADFDSEPIFISLDTILPSAKGNCTIVVFGSFEYLGKAHHRLIGSGLVRRWDAVWEKVSGGFKVSEKVPIYRHELIVAYGQAGTPVQDFVFNGYDAGEDGEPWERVNNTRRGATDHVYRGKKDLPYSSGSESGKRWFTSVMSGREKPVMTVPERTPHPTQKPEEVLNKLVSLVTNAGGVVLDPFLGSGTTLVACQNLNRRGRGIEVSPAYCAVILERMITAFPHLEIYQLP